MPLSSVSSSKLYAQTDIGHAHLADWAMWREYASFVSRSGTSWLPGCRRKCPWHSMQQASAD
eukprot:11199986-Lingulodinium_polyedra.AAC.1